MSGRCKGNPKPALSLRLLRSLRAVHARARLRTKALLLPDVTNRPHGSATWTLTGLHGGTTVVHVKTCTSFSLEQTMPSLQGW